MNAISIPAWNAQGILPPFDQDKSTSAERAPYRVALSEIILRFGNTPERRKVLDGFLRYRAALHDIGLTQGFQWLDGSFMENIEILERRPPNDIDVVTFFDVPADMTQMQLMAKNPALFPADKAGKDAIKTEFFVDSALIRLGMQPKRLIAEATYWYSMWSHRRDGIWKGYLQIDLHPAEDNDAGLLLSQQGLQP